MEEYSTARQATDDNTKRNMHFACWIHKAANIHSELVTFNVFPLQYWFTKTPQYYVTRTLPDMLHYSRDSCRNTVRHLQYQLGAICNWSKFNSSRLQYCCIFTKFCEIKFLQCKKTQVGLHKILQGYSKFYWKKLRSYWLKNFDYEDKKIALLEFY